MDSLHYNTENTGAMNRIGSNQISFLPRYDVGSENTNTMGAHFQYFGYSSIEELPHEAILPFLRNKTGADE